ncbi:hypothetical protein FBZ89_1544 [Nitrospirillum amazonense]|uniref:DDE family transposase n=1 Tax=Nitrospirillum amazonense TaxID=28077 RepID=A0A560EHE2_9PROT|nr:hypothetical protein FBZ89_1544 [Nitrospirillum amazonense]
MRIRRRLLRLADQRFQFRHTRRQPLDQRHLVADQGVLLSTAQTVRGGLFHPHVDSYSQPSRNPFCQPPEQLRPLRDLAIKVSMQTQRQRGQKVYSFHAPEVECIGKGKARAPYEFGCKVSVAVPITKPKGGLFVLHAQALHTNPFDGHTLAKAVADIKANTGREPDGVHIDRGYRGHDHPNKFKVWITGQVRRTTAAIKREMKRRAAIEPIIGHLKAEHRMGRNYLKGRTPTSGEYSPATDTILPPPDEQPVGVHVVTPRGRRSRHARLERRRHDLPLQRSLHVRRRRLIPIMSIIPFADTFHPHRSHLLPSSANNITNGRRPSAEGWQLP